MGKILKKIIKHYGKKVRIDLREPDGKPNAWTGREFGDYFIVGIDTCNDELKVNLKATETGVSMWYKWDDKFQLLRA